MHQSVSLKKCFWKKGRVEKRNYFRKKHLAWLQPSLSFSDSHCNYKTKHRNKIIQLVNIAFPSTKMNARIITLM